MFDFTFKAFDFCATTIQITAVSEAAKAWTAAHIMPGAVGFELPKSQGEKFAEAIRVAGLTIAAEIDWQAMGCADPVAEVA